MQSRFVLEGSFRHEQEKAQVHLPFVMPPGATRLAVSYAYSDKIGSDPLLEGGNTVDLGVFDERGIAYLAAGFRGWSGSERMSFFISEDEATPGYLAGPLQSGRWHILLGLYKIAPEGCSYRVEITVDSEPSHTPTGSLFAPVASLPVSPPPAPFAPWLRGELHCHTWHSDGDSSPADVVALARRRGLDFLAISDHNSTAIAARSGGPAQSGVDSYSRRRGNDDARPFQRLGQRCVGGLPGAECG